MACSKKKVDVYLDMCGVAREKQRERAENCVLWVSDPSFRGPVMSPGYASQREGVGRGS